MAISLLPTTSIAAADYAIGGLNTKLLIRASLATNGTSPSALISIGLYPVTSSGAAGTITVAAGTLVPGSLIEVAADSATIDEVNEYVSGQFFLPADGAYALGLDVPDAADAAFELDAQLEVFWSE